MIAIIQTYANGKVPAPKDAEPFLAAVQKYTATATRQNA